MSSIGRHLRLSLVTLLVALAPAAVASAQAQDSAQRACIVAMNRGLARVSQAQARSGLQCIRDAALGRLVGPVEACLVSDPLGRVVRMQDRTVSDEVRRCTVTPDFGFAGSGAVNQAGVDQELGLVHDVLGPDLDAGVILGGSVERRCQYRVTRAVQRCERSIVNDLVSCKSSGLRGGAIVSASGIEACFGDDARGRIARTCDDLLDVQIDRCLATSPLSTLFPGSCASDDPATLSACLRAAATCRTCLAANASDGLGLACDSLDDGLPNLSCTGAAPQASARVIASASDLIGGPLARGRIGDVVLENENVRAIVQAPQRNFSGGVGQFGGNLIDVDLVRGPSEPGRDLFEEWSFMINLENTANYTSVVVLNDGSDGNAAIVRATGVDDLLDRINPSTVVRDFGFPFPSGLDDTDQPVQITTDYILEPGETALRIETTVTNVGASPISLFLGDFLSPLGQEIFHPGYGIGEPLVTTDVCDPSVPCDFAAYAGEGQTGGVSYGYIHTTAGTTSFNTDGVGVMILGEAAVNALLGIAGPNFAIAPGGIATVTRYLAVGDGDVASIADARNRLRSVPNGTISGRVTRGGLPAVDAEVVALASPLLGPGNGTPLAPFTTTHVVTQFRTDANGDYSGTLPVGSFDLRVNLDGHDFGTPDPAAIVMTDGGVVSQDFTLADPATLRITIEDELGNPIAGTVSVVGFDPSPDPGNAQSILGLINNQTGVFGRPKDPFPYGLADLIFVDHTGDSGDLPLEPGDYRLVVSHGTEYSIHVEDVTATSGGAVNVNAVVTRVVDSTGFISGDFHVHSIDSVDAAVTRRDRIISMLAAGVDFFTPSDHEFRADFTQDVLDLGVSSLISTAVSNEVTPFDYGHLGGFPVAVDPSQVNGGAVDWGRAAPAGQDFPSFGNFNLGPGEIFAAIQSDPGEQSVHVNHVASFFDGGLRFNTGVAPPISTGNPSNLRLDPSVPNYWDAGFTALELWIQTSRSQDGRLLDQNFGNWFNLLNQGILRTGFGDSDTHHLVRHQAGQPRSYLASPSDDPGALAPLAETLAGVMNDGHVTSTNGPFLRVSAEGDAGELGGLGFTDSRIVRTTGGSATLTVEIQSPTWAEFDTVSFYVNSETIPDTTGRGALPPLYRSCPDVVQTEGVDFTVNVVPVSGDARLEASTTLNLSGLTVDTWVVAVVRGTDNVSCPLFPVVANDIDPTVNATLASLRTCETGDRGVTSLAFSNPIFFDVDGNGVFDPPGLSFQPTCP